MSEPKLRSGEWNAVKCDEAGVRLDVYVTHAFPELSRARVQKLIEDEFIRLNGKIGKANSKVQLGDQLEVFLPTPKPIGLKAEEIPIEVLYEDAHLAVIEKPAGLVIHPAAGHEDGTLVNALLHRFTDLASGSGIGGELRPGIVHRIDRNTSGILLITKTDEAHKHLSEQFKVHSITRKYLGLAWGILPEKGEWDAPIARDPKERKRMAIVPGGRRALTKFRRLEVFQKHLSLFEAELFTGRTHQIRVHFSSHGYPLVGDPTYIQAHRSARQKKEEGQRVLQKHCTEAFEFAKNLHEKERQFLHAAHLGFTHPGSGERMEFSSNLPPDLQELVLSLRQCETKTKKHNP